MYSLQTNRSSSYVFIGDKCVYSPNLEHETSIMNGNYVVKVTVIIIETTL